MNIREYLTLKYQTDKPTSMLSCERKVFNIKMQHGWLELYGDKLICAETEARLRLALKKRNCASANLGLAILDGAFNAELSVIRSNKETARQIKQARSSRWKSTVEERVYIDCPYTDKNEAKMLGARWDTEERLWYVPQGVDLAPFIKWIHSPDTLTPHQNPDGSVVYLQ
jgi:hypothetical protein